MSSGGQIPRSFPDTCVPIEYRCTPNDKYIDPCNCTSYYLCQYENQIISQACSQGTGFNHKTNRCDTLVHDLVFDDLCDIQEPWKRCSDVDDYEDELDLNALQRRCTGHGPAGGGGGDDGGGNGGLIAGVIVAVLLIAIIAVALIIYVRKRGNPIRQLKGSRVWRSMTQKNTGSGGQGAAGQPSAPHYAGSGHGEEETYAEIADTAVYKDPSGGKPQAQTQLSHSNETYEKDEEPVAYDNPALQLDETLQRRPRHPLPPDSDPPVYSPLEEKEQAIRSYASLNDHRAIDGAAPSKDSKELVTGDDGYLMAEAIRGTPSSSSPVDPGYFVLEKS